LLRIEEELDDAARYAGAAAFPRYEATEFVPSAAKSADESADRDDESDEG